MSPTLPGRVHGRAEFPFAPNALEVGIEGNPPSPVCSKLDLVGTSASKRAILQVNGEPSPESLSTQKDNLSPVREPVDVWAPPVRISVEMLPRVRLEGLARL